MMANLVSRAAEYKAIQSIIREMEEEKLSPGDPQRIRADSLMDEYRFQLLSRDDATGISILRLTPVHGDGIYFEIEEGVTTGSMKIEDPKSFQVKDLMVSFLCVDSKGCHEKGWRADAYL
jgi:hypothetical protein